LTTEFFDDRAHSALDRARERLKRVNGHDHSNNDASGINGSAVHASPNIKGRNGRAYPHERILAASEFVIQCASGIELTNIAWLWPQRFAIGKVSMIAGDPGLGKSQALLNIAATVTTGGTWPVTGEQCEQGNVIMLSAEDDASDTIAPRFVAAGGNTDHFFLGQSVAFTVLDERGEETLEDRAFRIDRDVEALERAIVRVGNVRLVVFDPITAYLGDTDSHKNAEVRVS
jgi:putative DNA primase/helicase